LFKHQNIYLPGKNDFVEVESKNLNIAGYKSENNVVGLSK